MGQGEALGVTVGHLWVTMGQSHSLVGRCGAEVSLETPEEEPRPRLLPPEERRFVPVRLPHTYGAGFGGVGVAVGQSLTPPRPTSLPHLQAAAPPCPPSPA